jgi:hypothetical protein
MPKSVSNITRKGLNEAINTNELLPRIEIYAQAENCTHTIIMIAI